MTPKRQHKTTVTVRLAEDEYAILQRLCRLKKTTCTGYLARLVTDQAKQDLLHYAVDAYLSGQASVSTLARETGLDVPTILDAVTTKTGEDTSAIEGFLSAVKTLSQESNDPELYEAAIKALK